MILKDVLLDAFGGVLKLENFIPGKPGNTLMSLLMMLGY
jgi:hypothetical protein